MKADMYPIFQTHLPVPQGRERIEAIMKTPNSLYRPLNICLLFLVLLTLPALSGCLNQDPQLVCVDVQKVLTDSKAAREANAHLTQVQDILQRGFAAYQEELKKILPHRDNMLLIDECELVDGEAHGKCHIRPDQWFLQGHFPGNPTVPGVVLCEMMAQTCCVLLAGKGGVGYVMQTAFGITMPRAMKEDMGYKVKHVSDVGHRELKPADIYDVFKKNYLENHTLFDIGECHFRQTEGIDAAVVIAAGGAEHEVLARGNGRLDAVSNAVKAFFGLDYSLVCYEQHALSQSSASKAISYVGVESGGNCYFGAGVDDDIIKSSYKALTSAVNNLLAARSAGRD